MAPLSLLDSVRAAFGSETVRKASAFLGDPEPSVRKSLDSIIPVTLAALVNRAETAGAESVTALANAASREDRLGNLAEHFVAGTDGFPAGASSLVQGLFGERYGAVANAVASYTGGRASTISALFGSIVPYVLSLLGRHIASNNLSPTDVSAVLAGQKSSIWAAVPTDLNLASLLAPPSRPAPSYVTASGAPAERANPWLLPVLLLLIAGGVAWWLMRTRSPEPIVSAGLDTARRPTVAPAPAPADTLPAVQGTGGVSLPSGVKLDAARGGLEDRLVTFLSDPAAKPDENLWFDFVHLDFEPGSARIVPSSRKELTNLVQILKAFPSVRVKVGGFTDSTGNEAANLQLSKARAEAVASALQAGGVGGQIAGVEGYGSAQAKVSASAPEVDRRRDRRLGVAVWVR